jgi:hypothetical protein
MVSPYGSYGFQINHWFLLFCQYFDNVGPFLFLDQTKLRPSLRKTLHYMHNE